jgi:acyl-CoA synthetase (AMP-forming)/AMP-acid ligase II
MKPRADRSTGTNRRITGAGDDIRLMGDALRLRGFLADPAEIERRPAEHPDVVTAKVVKIRASTLRDWALERPGNAAR